MDPKEKAAELVDKFIKTNGNSFFAKECVLIAVDETINALEIHQWQNKSVIEYYLEVKQEIENYGK